MATKSKTITNKTPQTPNRTQPRAKGAKSVTTKKKRLLSLLSRKSGASLDALQKEFGWQPHTVRAAISGVRKGGDAVVRVTGKSGPVYRIDKAAAAQ